MTCRDDTIRYICASCTHMNVGAKAPDTHGLISRRFAAGCGTIGANPGPRRDAMLAARKRLPLAGPAAQNAGLLD